MPSVVSVPITAYRTTFDQDDLVLGVLPIVHSLGQKYPGGCLVYDNSDDIVAVKFTPGDTTTGAIDLSNLDPITGTWRLTLVV